MNFGPFLRDKREALQRERGADFTLRQVAGRVDLQPSYLSRIEQGKERPPSKDKICALAAALGEDPDVLLALAGKVSEDLQEIIRRHPRLFAQLIRQLKDAPEGVVLRLVEEVRDGDW